MSDPFRIAIAGLGTVGVGVADILTRNAELLRLRSGRQIEIAAVSARDRSRPRDVELTGMQWIDDPLALADLPDVDAVVELIGGAEGVARDLALRSLNNSKGFITANKALMAHHGFELASIAEKNGVSIGFEAAVAGGVPVIKGLREGLAANRMTAVYGILNGTCNYILTQMRRKKRNFHDVLSEAQQKGYAEADPSLDIDGIDAAHKICLLASIAFGVRPDFKAIHISGIRSITPTDISFAAELEYRIKLLGIAKREGDKLSISVEPCLVPKSSPLGMIEDVYNAVSVEGDFVETPLFTGLGAGRGPTASSVVADIVDQARGIRIPAFGIPADSLEVSRPMGTEDIIAPYYLRLTVLDRPGVLADVSAILRDHNISIEGLLQRGRDPDQPVPVMITTHEARYEDMLKAVQAIGALNTSVEPPCLMRVEENL